MTTLLSLSDVKLLFHWNFYDVPLSGALEWNGERYWFAQAEEVPPNPEETWLNVMSISEDDWAKVDEEQALFEQYVGRHTRYDGEGKRNLSDQEPHTWADDDTVLHPYWDRPDDVMVWEPKGSVVARLVL